jgi:dipeptidyl-peptidase-4
MTGTLPSNSDPTQSDPTEAVHNGHDEAVRRPDLPALLARSQRLTLGLPRDFTLAPDRDLVVFIRTRGGEDRVGCLWALENGRERLLVDPETLAGASKEIPEIERARREREGERSTGIVSYTADRSAERVAFALGGRLWLLRVDRGEARPIDAAEPAAYPRLDPEGRRIAYVCKRSLRIVDVDGGEVLALESGDHEIRFGVSDHLAMAESRGCWWSPDGRKLLVTRVNSRGVARAWIPDLTDQRRQPRQIVYAFAGTPPPGVALIVVDLAGGRQVAASWDHSRFPYLLSANWDESGPIVSVMSRDQRNMEILSVDPDTGQTSVLTELSDPAWVTRVRGCPLRTETGRLVSTVDEDGDRRLAVDGATVSPAGVQVRQLLAVTGESVLFTACEDPTEEHVWRWDADAGPVRLTDEPGVHTAVAAEAASVVTSRTDGGWRSVSSCRGRPDMTIASLQNETGLSVTPTWLVLGPRAIRTALLLPSWHERGSDRLPVLVDPYGGPAVQRVTRTTYRSWQFAEAQWFAEQGFAVVIADGSGTPGRGPAWEREVHGDSLTTVIDDQVAALHGAAASEPDLDLSRVAIRGWSFGGTLAAAAVLRRPDVFHAAIAGAAPTDAAEYNCFYRERFLGTPQENPDGYRRGSILNEAATLSRPLLLIHGVADSNVLVSHTIRMSNALFEANRPHDLFLLPNSTHMTTDETAATSLLLRQLAFLRTHLQDGRPIGSPDRAGGRGDAPPLE